jgi:hypothetical protein
MGRYIVMIISLIQTGKKFLPTPSISIMARKAIQKKAELMMTLLQLSVNS